MDGTRPKDIPGDAPWLFQVGDLLLLEHDDQRCNCQTVACYISERHRVTDWQYYGVIHDLELYTIRVKSYDETTGRYLCYPVHTYTNHGTERYWVTHLGASDAT